MTPRTDSVADRWHSRIMSRIKDHNSARADANGETCAAATFSGSVFEEAAAEYIPLAENIAFWVNDTDADHMDLARFHDGSALAVCTIGEPDFVSEVAADDYDVVLNWALDQAKKHSMTLALSNLPGVKITLDEEE